MNLKKIIGIGIGVFVLMAVTIVISVGISVSIVRSDGSESENGNEVKGESDENESVDAVNDEFDNVEEIYLIYDFDASKGYYLSKKYYKFSFYNNGTNKSKIANFDICAYVSDDVGCYSIGNCNFSSDKFDEIYDLCFENELVDYTPPTDDNGKIEYETVPVAIAIKNNGDLERYFVPDNIDEIAEAFEKLAESVEINEDTLEFYGIDKSVLEIGK